MWFYAEKLYQKLPFRNRPLFSRLDVPLDASKYSLRCTSRQRSSDCSVM